MRPEEEGLLFFLVVQSGNEYWTADRVSEIVLLIWSNNAGAARFSAVEVVLRVEHVVAHKLVGIAVERLRSALRFNFDCTRSVAAVLRAVVRSENLELGDRVDTGIHVQRAVAAVVHVVPAIEFPVVVFGAAAVHAESDAAIDADRRLVHPGLIAHARDEADEGRKVSSVQFKLGDFLARYRARELGGLRFHLGHIVALDNHLGANGADFERDIDTSLFSDVELYPLGFVLLEAGRRHDDVVRARRQGRLVVLARRVGCRLAGNTALRTGDHDVGAGNGSSAGIFHGAGDRASLCRCGRTQRQDQRHP